MRKITKENYNTFFSYFGWTIPVFLIVFWAIFYFTFRQIYATKPYEQLVFYYAAYGLKDNSVHNKLQKALEPKQCYEVNYYDYTRDSSEAYKSYTAVSSICDFFVFSETDLNDMQDAVKSIFMPITNEFADKIHLPAAYSFFQFESVNYGIKLNDKNDATYEQNKKYSSYINFSKGSNTDSFYLVINKNSVNFNEDANHVLGYLGLDYLFNELD